MVNNVTLAGNLTRDIEVRSTASGKVVGAVGLAVNDRWLNKETGEWEDRPYFFDLVIWGSRAESLAPYLVRGRHITVQGKLVWSSWEDVDGTKRSRVEINVGDIDLGPRGSAPTSPERPGDEDAEDAVTELAYDDIPF